LQKKYVKRANEFAQKSNELKEKYNRFSMVRLLVFFTAAFIAVFLFSKFNIFIGCLFIALFLFGFGKFIFWHRAILHLSKHYQFLSEINEKENAALNHEYQQFGAGADFMDPLHPNVIDMDIFGNYSLFQYCNRTSTAIGEAELARFLSTTATKDEIFARQKAIKELSQKLDWRQHFQAHGSVTEDNIDHLHQLNRWLADAPFVINNRWLKAALIFVPIWMSIGLFLSFYFLSWKISVLFVLLPAYILMKTVKKVNDTHNQTTHAEKILSFYGKLIRHIEKESFETDKLKSLKNPFLKESLRASKEIHRLSYIIGQLNVRYNAFAVLFNLMGLWDLYWVKQLEHWKEKNKANLADWFAALQEFEALISLATLHYNNPDWVFPTIAENTLFNGVALGHPLIHHSKRITNDFNAPTQGHIKLITGSNMAGKSTFLRTVGINIILAMSGSAVCAKELTLPLLEVYSSMRTQDALHESTSSFYAELKRLKMIIEAVQQKGNVFFLLDEILKGTNSKDRHTGSRALIEQMIKKKGAGIIATHDLELGNMEAKSDGAIENLCMEVAVENGALRFAYKLEKGVSKSFNATILMREMGIDIN
jgi:DNA mismatch repair ATPase MutS